MPYIVTAYGPNLDQPNVHDGISRRAVATLETARQHLLDRYGSWWTSGMHESLAREIVTLPESGGTVGPLPDGTIIEVERVSLNDLRTGIGTFDMSPAEVIAAFNVRESHAR